MCFMFVLCVVYGVGACVFECCLSPESGCCQSCCHAVQWACGVLSIRLICDTCSRRCYLMGSICASSCRCWAPASDAHPAATPSAVFCVFCRLVMFISAASGAQTVGVHSNMDRMVVVLYPRP